MQLVVAGGRPVAEVVWELEVNSGRVEKLVVTYGRSMQQLQHSQTVCKNRSRSPMT